MKPSSAYQIRNTHSVCLEEHKVQTAEISRIRAAQTLITRAPSYPCHVVDNSVALIEETNVRRKLHTGLMSDNPNGFKRTNENESSSQVLNEKMLVANMIGYLHQVRDSQDLDKSHRYTYSRLGDRRPNPDREKPLEDFIQPGNQSRERTTGYNQGHIRSILGLDAYGPNSSANNQQGRALGSKPPSPNLDRHSREGESNLRETIRSRQSTASTNEERSIKSNNMNINNSSNNKSKKDTFRNRQERVLESFVTSGEFGASIELPGMVGKNKDVMAGTLGYYGNALTEDEKILANTNLKGTRYFESYKKSLADRSDIKNLTKKMREHKDRMRREADTERHAIEQFEFRLESAKITGGGV